MVTRVGESHELPAAIWSWHMQTDGSNLNLIEFWQYQHFASLFSSAVIFLAFQSPEVMGLAFFFSCCCFLDYFMMSGMFPLLFLTPHAGSLERKQAYSVSLPDK